MDVILLLAVFLIPGWMVCCCAYNTCTYAHINYVIKEHLNKFCEQLTDLIEEAQKQSEIKVKNAMALEAMENFTNFRNN